MQGQLEKKLIKGCLKGDRSAQNELYNLYSAKMFAVCLRYSRTKEEAEDTFHDGFMKIYQNLSGYRNEGSFEGWMRKIMVNTAIEKYRKNSHLSVVLSLDSYNGNGLTEKYYTEDIIANLEVEELMEMIQKLPPAYKMVFNLYVFEGLKHKEIAESLGISEGTSKSNLSDARKILQKTINKQNKQDISLIRNG